MPNKIKDIFSDDMFDMANRMVLAKNYLLYSAFAGIRNR